MPETLSYLIHYDIKQIQIYQKTYYNNNPKIGLPQG